MPYSSSMAINYSCVFTSEEAKVAKTCKVALVTGLSFKKSLSKVNPLQNQVYP